MSYNDISFDIIPSLKKGFNPNLIIITDIDFWSYQSWLMAQNVYIFDELSVMAQMKKQHNNIYFKEFVPSFIQYYKTCNS